MHDMLSALSYAASVLVPSHGWLIFGGYNNNLLTWQKIQSVTDIWYAGPNLYQTKSDWDICAAQVNMNIHNVVKLLFCFPLN